MPPNLLNSARSSSEGSYTPLGWEWTVPTTAKSGGSMCNWKIACRLPLNVPGTKMSSVIVPSSARRIAPNSSGCVSRDAARIIRRVFRAIASMRFIPTTSLPRDLLLDPAIERVLKPDELRPAFRRSEHDVLRAFQARLVLAVHDEEAFLRLEEPNVDLAPRGEQVGTRGGLERGDCCHDDRVQMRVDDRPARGHRVRSGPRRGRDDHPVCANALHDLLVQPNLEVPDLRDVCRVDDRLVRAIEHAFPVHDHPEPHPLLDLVVPSDRPFQRRVRLVRVDLREEAEGPRVDPQDLRVGELEGPEDRPVSADPEHDLPLHFCHIGKT